MANNKYCIKEYTPKENMPGSHGFYAQAVVDNVITNKELAKKIEARGISRAAEIKSILEEAANIIMEEIAENNRVQIESGNGILVSIYPSCSGSISDTIVQQNPEKYNNAQVATADMLTADMLTWTVGAQVGRNFNKQFALNKTAQQVAYSPTQQTAEPQEEGSGTTTNPSSEDDSGNGFG